MGMGLVLDFVWALVIEFWRDYPVVARLDRGRVPFAGLAFGVVCVDWRVVLDWDVGLDVAYTKFHGGRFGW